MREFNLNFKTVLFQAIQFNKRVLFYQKSSILNNSVLH